MRKQDDTPGGLAAELDASVQKRDEKIERANQVIDRAHIDHHDVRANILQRGIDRMRQIKNLIAELEEEHEGLSDVVRPVAVKETK